MTDERGEKLLRAIDVAALVVEVDELREENERLRALLEPCRPDTNTQTDQSYPKTVNDVLSLLSAYISDFLPDDICPDDEYFGAWERQARKVVEPIMREREEARAALAEILDRAEDDDVVSCIAIASKAIGLRTFVGNSPNNDDEAAEAGGDRDKP